jgi:voltage-gated potassium channel
VNNSYRRIVLALAGIGVLIAVGTTAYAVIEHMSFIDALYMTVITITTVGYGEVKPLDTAGRVFTMALILTGVGTAYYVFAAVTDMVVGGQLRQLVGKNAMSRKIHHLQGHVIICGYGRFGHVVVDELRRHRMTVVAVDNDPGKEAELIRADIYYVIGSALDEDILDEAGIRNAADIVVATASDPDNVYISLSARDRNPQIRIHARAESEIGLKHLQLAGADRAISSYQWSAMRIANAIARPSVIDFLNLILPGQAGEPFSVEEVRVPARSASTDKTIAMLEDENDRVRIVALKRGDAPIQLVPGPRMQIEAGDLLIAIGERTSLGRLAEFLEK